MTYKLKSKKEKILFVIPLALIPLGILAYVIYVLYGPADGSKTIITKSDGFNAKLPSPNIHPGEKNKLELYMEAQRDSLKKREAENQDPYSKRLYDPGTVDKSNVLQEGVEKFTLKTSNSLGTDLSKSKNVDPNELKVNQRLEKLYAAIRQSAPSDSAKGNPITRNRSLPSSINGTEKIESLISRLHEKDTSSDPKMDQLSGMLDKIMAIQHPEMVNKSIAQYRNKKAPETITVSTTPTQSEQLSWNDTDPETQNTSTIGFYGWSDQADSITAENETIQAVIHDQQTVHSGSSVKIRLLQDIYLGKTRISRGSFVTGYCTIDGERVNIQLNSINFKNQIYAIKLKVYDMDGMEGISVPGAMTRDAAKEGLSQGVSTVGMNSFDPGLAGQATAATIETAKSLLSRKAKLIQATLKADHKILLRKV